MPVNNIIYISIFFVLGLANHHTAPETYTLTVNITGLQSSKGNVICNLHNDKQTFPKKKLVKKSVTIEYDKASVIFEGVSKGVYAVTAIHDENSNGKLDFNFFHIPSEKTASSNDAKGFFGPPKFEDASFSVDKNTQITIRLE